MSSIEKPIYETLNAYVCEKVEKELKKLDIYEPIFNEWSEVYFQFMKKLNPQFVDEKSNFDIYSNMNIKLDIIEREVKRKRRNKSHNSNITLDYIKKYKDLSWDMSSICISSDKISFHEMKEFYEDGNVLNIKSFHEIVFEFMHDITLKDVIYNMDLGYNWNLQLLSSSHNITFNEYKKHQNHPFIKHGNRYCEEDDLDKQKFDMNFNPTITKKDIMENPDYPWNKLVLLKNNKNLSFEDFIELGYIDAETTNSFDYHNNNELFYVEKYKKINWFNEEKCMSLSKKVTMNDIKNNPQYKWDIQQIFDNPNMTFDYLMENYEKTISNPFIEPDIYIDYFYINECLSSNPFTFERVNWILGKITSYYIQNKLYEELMIKAWHPKRVENWCFSEDEKMDIV